MEIENYRVRIKSLHELIHDAIEGLPEDALNWRPVQGEGDHATNSLAVLVAHIAGAEYHWITEVVGKRQATRVWEVEFTWPSPFWQHRLPDASGK